jgi:hypothetical protein|tara:strand:+ start:7428 stop:7592 length:165 start_codon:yes stop_codon:yes gene_type:complete
MNVERCSGGKGDILLVKRFSGLPRGAAAVCICRDVNAPGAEIDRPQLQNQNIEI